MAKLKMLKMPKAPKLPKKPKTTASLVAKQNWLKRYNDAKAKYKKQVDATKKENAHRAKTNSESVRLSTVISGVSKIEIFPRGFSAKSIRRSPAKRKSKAAGTKKAAPKRKVATKRKAAPKKVARKKAAPKKVARKKAKVSGTKKRRR